MTWTIYKVDIEKYTDYTSKRYYIITYCHEEVQLLVASWKTIIMKKRFVLLCRPIKETDIASKIKMNPYKKLV